MKNHKNKEQKILVKICKNEVKENLAPYFITKKIKKNNLGRKNHKPLQDITYLFEKKEDLKKNNN